jgi:hypothetical protein
MWFLFHFSDLHAKFRNIVAFPLAPVGFAQACQHRVAFVLDHDHQVVFVCLIARALKQHPDGLVGTFGDEDRMARSDVDGLPRLVQIQAESSIHNVIFLCAAKTLTYIGQRFASSEPPTSEHVADMLTASFPPAIRV